MKTDTPHDVRNIQILMKNYVIRIPKIQREYAQGRTEGKAPKVRKAFIDDLFKAVCNDGSALQLDLVYGLEAESSESKPSFLPIDGQQRLTTLYLLAWFCGTSDMNDWVFDYKSRRAAQFFMEGLRTHPRNGGSPRKELEEAEWFHKSWVSDPSVAGMVVMLEEMFKHRNDSVDVLRKSARISNIRFTVEEGICGSGMSEEDAEKAYGHLFLKMNARGLPLTDWEVAKNEIDKHAENDSAWKENVNSQWQENLWSLTIRKDEDNSVPSRVVRLDVAMLAIATMCARFCGKSTDDDFGKCLAALEKEGKKNLFFEWCEDSFQYAAQIACWWSQDRCKNELWLDCGTEQTCADKTDNGYVDCDEFAKWLTKGNPSFADQLRFAFLIRGGNLAGTPLMKRRLRTLLNLLDNTDIDREKFDSCLEQGLNYLVNGCINGLDAFLEDQLKDENWKWLFEEEAIRKIEKLPLIWRGSTAFLGEACPKDMLTALSKLQEATKANRKGLFLSLLGLSEKCDEGLPCRSIWIPEVDKEWAEECFSVKRLFLRKGVAAWLKNERYNTDSGSSAWLNYLSELWDKVENCGLKKIATKDSEWLFCVGNKKLTNDAIRLVRRQEERSNLGFLEEAATTDSGIPYITWGKLPYDGFMKAKANDWSFNVKWESWWKSTRPERYVQGEDGSFQVLDDGEIQGNP